MTVEVIKIVTCDACNKIIENGEWYQTEHSVISSKDKGKSVRKDICAKCYNERIDKWA